MKNYINHKPHSFWDFLVWDFWFFQRVVAREVFVYLVGIDEGILLLSLLCFILGCLHLVIGGSFIQRGLTSLALTSQPQHGWLFEFSWTSPCPLASSVDSFSEGSSHIHIVLVVKNNFLPYKEDLLAPGILCGYFPLIADTFRSSDGLLSSLVFTRVDQLADLGLVRRVAHGYFFC